MKAEKDKNRIWSDCAECAYKHLTAAYALMSSYLLLQNYNADAGAEWMTLVARANIAAREAVSGYRGNRDLAVGCLAAAEVQAPPLTALLIRAARLEYEKSNDLRLVEGLPVNDAAYVLAHLTEAARELPELVLDEERAREFSYVYYNRAREPEAADKLAAMIQHVRETYELEGTKDEGKEADVPEQG